MGRRTRKSVAALAGRLPACDPARPRSAGAGFGSEGRRRAAWNRTWAPGLPDMGCDLSAIAGALARVTSGRRVEDGGAFPSRGAATLIGTASPVPLTVDMLTGPLAARRLSMRNGYGAAQHVRRKTGINEKDERRELLDAVADAGRLARGLDQLLESMAHADQLDPLDVEGILALRSISERCAERIEDAARILEAAERGLLCRTLNAARRKGTLRSRRGSRRVARPASSILAGARNWGALGQLSPLMVSSSSTM